MNKRIIGKALAFRLRCRGTLSGGLALSRFVAALLQGLNCLANPPGVGPFHSVSSFRSKRIFYVHSIKNVEILHILHLISFVAKRMRFFGLIFKQDIRFKHQFVRCHILRSDSPTSRQLHIEADPFEQTAHNEISKPPSA
ncbi:hypothetical protein BBI15_09875 [Planococcus plakortidis]|uniref:Uncharacterized protein n=1 Tax=Planococcus plakortidis TaxID=1038856 RepID=A0A1C7EAP9_9BACL|nr:hypothetical protein BBI15_09875 [Planococcus plakortidis]